jgi:4-aminobutyrate--pyruvate transaminase
VAKRAEAHGVIVRALVDTVALCPPLIVTEAQVDEIFDGVTKALDDTAAWVRANAAAA